MKRKSYSNHDKLSYVNRVLASDSLASVCHEAGNPESTLRGLYFLNQNNYTWFITHMVFQILWKPLHQYSLHLS